MPYATLWGFSDPWYFGSYLTSFSYAGDLDEIEIFDRALAPAEISSIFAADSYGKCKPGACCRGEVCTLLSRSECDDAAGHYLGELVSCDPNPCLDLVGACCIYGDSPSCIVTTQEDCGQQGGIFQGYGTNCDTPCPRAVGACCFQDLTCVLMTSAECEASGGVYLGDWTTCDTPCPPPTGACCFYETAECFVMTAAECAATGGSYQDDNVPCVPDPCGGVPIEQSTWGRIKSTYRETTR